MALAEVGSIQGWLAAHSVTTLFYLIAKDKSPEQARVALTGLLQFLKLHLLIKIRSSKAKPALPGF
jgi:hypothetical protein